MLKNSGIPDAIAEAMIKRGYEKLTPVQEEVIKKNYSGLDLLVSAQTGSGKTIAFGFSIVENILGKDTYFKKSKLPQALIIVPTRELALQVKNELTWFLESCDAKIISCVGGMDIRSEKRNLEMKPNIVVGTPGRLRDHIEGQKLKLRDIKTVVLDEADEMLDMGFKEDLEAILDTTPEEKQTLMFSATVPKTIAKLAKDYQKDAVRITVGKSNAQHVDIVYKAFKIVSSDQENAIINTLRYYEAANSIIFCATRMAVNHMTSRLTNRGISAVALSGELSQKERNMALQAMRSSKARVCVATDVAARGLDLPNLDLVIHADIPRTSDTLLHRSGRTGRAGRKGVCVILVPQNRNRTAERLFAQGNIKPHWTLPPSREEILIEDKKRILENKIFDDPIEAEEQTFVNELVSKNSINQLAVAYYRLVCKDLSVPEDLKNPLDKRDANSKNTTFTNSVWFELSIGRDKTAEPRWIVAMLCKAGNISKRDIGSIKVQPKVTYVEISEQTSHSLLEFVNNNKPIERHIMVRVLKDPPKLGRSTSRPSQNKKRSSTKLFLKDKDEDGSYKPKNIYLKGKRKSERWKKIEKRSKPKSDSTKPNNEKNTKRSKKNRVKINYHKY